MRESTLEMDSSSKRIIDFCLTIKDPFIQMKMDKKENLFFKMFGKNKKEMNPFTQKNFNHFKSKNHDLFF